MMIIIESVTVVFSLISLILTIGACIFPYWKEESSNEMFKNLSPNYNQGLWTRVSGLVGNIVTSRFNNDLA